MNIDIPLQIDTYLVGGENFVRVVAITLHEDHASDDPDTQLSIPHEHHRAQSTELGLEAERFQWQSLSPLDDNLAKRDGRHEETRKPRSSSYPCPFSPSALEPTMSATPRTLCWECARSLNDKTG